MRDNCSHCAFHFEREPGYFVGSMYISYTLSIVCVLVLTAAVHVLWPSFEWGNCVLIAAVLYIPFVSSTWRYSRMIWMYADLWAWPQSDHASSRPGPPGR